MSDRIRAMDRDGMLKALLSLKRPAVMPHRNPDGDAVGSAVATVRFLRDRGIEAALLSPDGIPRRLAFLAEGIPLFEGTPQEIVTVDVASLGQAGSAGPLIEAADTVYMIDHHAMSTPFAPHYIRPEASAVGEVLYDLFTEGGLSLTAEIAAPLYAAIASDTGNFRFRNVKPDTLRKAADLLEYGIDSAEISRRLFDIRTAAELSAMAYAIVATRSFYGGRLSVLPISRESLREAECAESDFDAVIDTLRVREGVEVAAVIRERSDGTVRLSLRTMGADAASLCALFGGGGHRVAAGCTLPVKTAEEGLSLLLAHADSLFEKNAEK
ncbi:MAG: DHH family phosphoesterase [Clostridia bacterium]|nr:DHH family phosphoesterase [Clostridia bacterium]